MDLERIKKEIEHQVRNGRNSIYLKIKDAFELMGGASKEIYGEERIYLSIAAAKQIIAAYESNQQKEEFFKRIKVDMPNYKLTKIDENGYEFEPIEKDRD